MQISKLAVGEPRALDLLGLGLRLDARDLEPVGDRREADAEARRGGRRRHLGEPPGLREVALGIRAIRIRRPVVLVHKSRQRHARRIKLEVALGGRAQHKKANDLRRIDRDDLDRLGADPLRARHLLAAECEELVLQARGRLLLEDLAVDLVRALTGSPRGKQVLAAFLVRDGEVIPLRAPLFVPQELRVALEG